MAEVAHAGTAGEGTRPAPIIESRVTSAASSSSPSPSRARRAQRDHEVAHLGGRIPDPNRGAFGQRDAEVGEHGARVLHDARAVGCALVPGGRQAEHRPRITTAQRADDHVVLVRRVLERNHVFTLAAAVAERGDGSGRVAREPGAKRWVCPGAGDDARAIARADLRLVGVDQHVECGRVDVALRGEHRLERAHAQFHRAQFAVVVLVDVKVAVAVSGIVAHGRMLTPGSPGLCQG